MTSVWEGEGKIRIDTHTSDHIAAWKSHIFVKKNYFLCHVMIIYEQNMKAIYEYPVVRYVIYGLIFFIIKNCKYLLK